MKRETSKMLYDDQELKSAPLVYHMRKQKRLNHEKLIFYL